MLVIALALVGLLSGFVNSLAGGGAIFPALILAGIPAIDANATATVIVTPTQFVSAWASRKVFWETFRQRPREIILLACMSVIGGTLGALLLFSTPPALFSNSVPWLLLLATLIYTWGTSFNKFNIAFVLSPAWCRILYLASAIYCGFFGAGIGIMILAVLALYGMRDIREMNSLKVLLSGLMSSSASVLLAFSGHVHWREALLMMTTTAIGGFLGTKFGMSIPRRAVEMTVIIVGAALTAYFFYRILAS
jgi:uncharacterized membrane protein YfcA